MDDENYVNRNLNHFPEEDVRIMIRSGVLINLENTLSSD
jgi:hypothetical protein